MRTWLSPAGALAAMAVGLAVAAGLGWRGLAVLLAFFVGSSLLTPGGGRRRPVQVLANGLVASVAALLSQLHPVMAHAFAGAVAAAAADTWSTELGSRGRRAPRMVTTMRLVPVGTSGGVSWPGSLGGALGASIIGGTACATGLVALPQALWIAASGVAGGLADSFVGATVQARYRCATCDSILESRTHDCPGTARLESGMRWITNDTTNLIATLAGAVMAAVPAALRAPALP